MEVKERRETEALERQVENPEKLTPSKAGNAAHGQSYSPTPNPPLDGKDSPVPAFLLQVIGRAQPSQALCTITSNILCDCFYHLKVINRDFLINSNMEKSKKARHDFLLFFR